MARNDHSGYPLKWFKDQNATRNAYECAICLEVLKDPVQVRDCGHQFCALCIDDILKTDPRCPTCRIEISDVMHEQDITEFKLKRSKNPWQRPKEKEKELSKEERKTAELYRNVMAILNKLTPENFKTLVEQFMELNIDTPERLEGAIDRIFEKAISEPMYSVAYANLCRCLFSIKVADAEGKDTSFRKLLLNRCQNAFERKTEDEEAFAEKLKQLEGLSEEERKAKKEEMDEALAKNKKRVLGNIRFIGEFFKLRLLTENIMHDCVFKLLRAGDEESLESMCMLLFTIGKVLDSDKAKRRIEQYFDQINNIIIAKKVSLRVIFKLRDVIELRQNKWIPRREENYNPKTIGQIHKEAQIEKMKERRFTAQLPAKNNKLKKGWPGGRDSTKPRSNDGWITTGKGGKSVPIDQNKLRNMAKRANNEEISVGPSARFAQWGRGSSAGLKNSSQEQDQPQANRFPALSGGGGGGDMPSNRPYDPRRPTSAGSRPSSGGSRGSDQSRVKSDKDRERALEAVRALSKPQNKKPQVTQNLYFSPDENNDELLQLLRADRFKNDCVFAYIEKNFKEEKRKEPEFISQLVTAVAESCIINKDQEVGPDCCQDKLKARKDILRKYLNNNNSLELQALFAFQEIYVKYNKPAAMLSQFFNTLYDEEVITEEAFMSWKRDENPLKQEEKASVLQATAAFFEWLQSAAVEGSEN